MNLLMFHTLRNAVQENASPGASEQVEAVEVNLREGLTSSGLFEGVEVGHTDDPDRLVIALCRFRPFLSEREVADRLEEIWADRVRYPFWESHGLRVERGHVELQAASRPSETGSYVTVHLVAQRGGIPAQRTATV
jgi:hypothetical protein